MEHEPTAGRSDEARNPTIADVHPESPALAPRAAPYVLAVAFSSALLFLVQPFAARELLPVAGGSPEVWNACILFFQAALVGGYAFAHLVCRRLAVRGAVAAYALAGVAAVSPGPLAPPAGVPEHGAEASFALAHLARTLGLPVLLLASTTPLVVHLAQARLPALSPRTLFASSNLAALLGLLAQPLFFAPRFGLETHRHALAWAFAVQVALVLAAALPALRFGGGRDLPSPSAAAGRFRGLLACMGLSALGASLLLGVTRHLATDIAPHPLLFAVPLALYLLTFVLAFGARRRLRVLHPLSGPIALALLVLSVAWWWLPTAASLTLHLGAFFVLALALHTRIAAACPPTGGLTGYWFALAIGGAAAGAAHTFVFPRIFDALYEYPFAVAAAALARDRSIALFPTAPHRRIRALALDLGLSSLALLFVPWNERHVVLGTHTLHRARNWFGVHRVLADDDGRFVRYHHGTTLHGIQALDRPGYPAGYYHPGTLVGRVLGSMGRDERRSSVFVVGLGAGTLAAYCREGDRFTFAEIDPESERIARRWFRYLSSARGEVRIRIGDGRRVLEGVPDRSIGILVLDAFSSDAVPIHLLTREAFALYRRKLRRDGLILVHVSNRHVDLAHAVAAVAASLYLETYFDPGRRPEGEMRDACLAAPWVAVARGAFDLPFDAAREGVERLACDPDDPVWTDDRADLLAYLRWRWR